MFESDQFIADCRQSLTEQNPHASVREIVAGVLESLLAVTSWFSSQENQL